MLESIFIPCWFIYSIIPKDIGTRTQKHRLIQYKLIIKHKVSVHLRMNFLLQLFSSTPCNWTSYIKCSFIWRWVNARNVLIKDSEIVNKWHTANTKQRSMDKAKEKSKDVLDSSATRWLGISVSRTDHDFSRKIGVDDIADLPNCPKKFEYGKDFLPHSLLQDCPGFMKRMHTWYRRACGLHLTSIWARYPPKVFDFQDIQEMFRLKEINVEMIRLWCM